MQLQAMRREKGELSHGASAERSSHVCDTVTRMKVGWGLEGLGGLTLGVGKSQ